MGNKSQKKYDEVDAHKIISFDIFDTLVLRDVISPSDIFDIVEYKYNKQFSDKKLCEFKAMRMQAERTARENKKKEILLDEIYRELEPKIAETDLLKQIEMQAEYMFAAPNIDIKKIYDYAKQRGKRIILVSDMYGHSNFYMKHGCDKDSYNVTENEIERLGYLYKKYIHLNKASEEYIDNEISELLCNKKTLGLHIRGTDYKLHLKNHPNYISCNEYISLAKKIVVENNFEQIFLATDDLEILNTFQREFEGKLVYYKDTFRTTGKEGTHNTHDSRPLHYYKLGLEVLRDVYTLANCDSLVCGLSQVSFAARYVSIALGRKFDEVVVLNNGINESNTKLAKRKNKTLSKTGNVES